MDVSQYLEIFLDETNEHLQNLNDQILVLDEGRIVGMGNHRELMKSCKEYQEIARSQLSMSELGGIE